MVPVEKFPEPFSVFKLFPQAKMGTVKIIGKLKNVGAFQEMGFSV